MAKRIKQIIIYTAAACVVSYLFLLFLFKINQKTSSFASNKKQQIHQVYDLQKIKDPIKPRVYEHLGKNKRNKMCDVIMRSFGESSDNIPSEPPRYIPNELSDLFTLNGHLGILDYYFSESSGTLYKQWTREQIDELIQNAKKNKNSAHYGDTNQHLFHALDKYKEYIKDKKILVIGSIDPWYESCALSRDAGSVTTLEYNDLHWDHPKITTYTVSEWKKMKNRETFDASISVSSIEHTGLGRYGDPINPFGDLGILMNLKCMLNVNGLLFLNVPVSNVEGYSDTIVWNAHRLYGPKMLSLLFDGWELLDVFGDGYNTETKWDGTYGGPIYVLKNIDFTVNDYFKMEFFKNNFQD